MPEDDKSIQGRLDSMSEHYSKKIEELEKKLKELGKFLGFEKYEDINGLGKIKITIETYCTALFGDRIEKLEKDRKAITKHIEYWGKETSELKKKIFHDYGEELNKIEDAAIVQIELVM